MAETIRITTPLKEEDSRKLRAGDSVLITGTIYSARDAAHKVMTEALARGEKLPIDWNNQIVYYLGPTPAKPGDPILLLLAVWMPIPLLCLSRVSRV